MSYPNYKYSYTDPTAQHYSGLNPPTTSQSRSQTPVHYAHQPPYDWSQQSHSYGNSDPQSYDNTSGWKADRGRSYHYSQQSPTAYTSTMTSNGYHATASESSTLALNSLAYASGLESAGIRGSQSTSSMATGYNTAAQQAPERIASPYGQQHQQQKQQQQPQSSGAYQMNRVGSSASRSSHQQTHHPSPKYSAGSLPRPMEQQAREVQYSYPPSSVSANTSSATRNANSPSVVYSSSASVSQTQKPRLSTPVGRNQNSTQHWNPPQQSQSNPVSHSRVPSQGADRQSSGLTSSAPSTNTATTTNSSYPNPSSNYLVPQNTQTQENAQPSYSSYSSYSTSQPTYQTQPQASPTYPEPPSEREFGSYSNQNSPSQTSMPTFIDPSQVFNPYQQEYERLKAAEEAAAAATARRETEERAQRDAQNTKPSESPPIHQSSCPTNTKGEKKKRPRKSAPNPKTNNLNESAADGRRRSHGSADSALQAAAAVLSSGMASKAPPQDDGDEMAKMVARMKEIKTKDPSRFEQLMGGLMGGNEATIPNPSSSAGPRTQLDSGASFMSSAKPVDSINPLRSKDIGHLPPQDNKQNLPDLGKFHALRRQRYNKNKPPPGENNNTLAQKLMTSSGASPSPAPQASPENKFRFPQPQSLRFGGQSESAASPGPLSATTEAQQASVPSVASASRKPTPTVWPPEKRKALAEAAVRTLLMTPSNRYKSVNASLILSLLDLNPSYPELCEKLESRGISLHRGNFAKALLQSVPDLGSSSHPPAPSNNTVQSPTNQALKIQQHTSAQMDQTPTASQLNTHGSTAAPDESVTTSAAYGPSSGDTLRLQDTLVSGTNVGNKTMHWAQPSTPANASYLTSFAPDRPPQSTPTTPSMQSTQATHGSAGRKGKLVPKLAPKGPKEAMARKRDFSEIVDLTADNDESEVDDEPPQKTPRVDDPNIDPQLLQPTTTTIATTTNNNNYNNYNSSSSKNTAAPLFDFPVRAVPNPISNPATAERAKEESMRRSSVRANIDLVQPIRRANALRKSWYNPLTIARDVLLASGRHPQSEPLNTHLLPLTKRLPQITNDSDLSTLRWDIIDPGGPAQKPDPSTELAQSVSPHGSTNTTSQRQASASAVTPTQAALVRLAQKKQQVSTSISTPHNVSTQRPPSSAGTPVVEISGKKDSYVSPSRHGFNPHNTMSSASSASLPRTPGRPPGAKNKNPSKPRDGSRAVPAHPTPRGPSRPSVYAPSKVTSSPSRRYNVYKCGWEGCGAELHNLATLKDHVKKTHGSSPGNMKCLWDKCSEEDEVYDKPSNSYRSVRKRVDFAYLGDLTEHVMTEHIEPIGWHLGEGPSVPSNDPTQSDSLPSYLLDFAGQLVTPIFHRDSNKPPDTIHFVNLPGNKIDRKGIMAFNRAHKKTTPQDKAKEVLRAMERKKATIGALIDKGGCTLVDRNNRHILDVGGKVQVVSDDDAWLYEGREDEEDSDDNENGSEEP